MKKIVITALFTFIGFFTQAQVNPHAIGLRLGGDGDANGIEVSYQYGMGDNVRLELDLGFDRNDAYNRLFLAGIYQWVWNIDGGFNWYAGPGAAIGMVNFESDLFDDYFDIGIGGQIGIEYDFSSGGDVPLLLSLDFRPMYNINEYDSDLGWGLGLGIRYIIK